MIVIRTGKPGNGKTLNAIREIDKQAKEQNRPVYYHNINGLQPEKLQADWYKFEDPLLWYELPQDSIIVVDEAQGNAQQPMFGVRDPRKDVPMHVSMFETLRHRGHEVHLITQDPRFLDVHIRRLCNRHIHFWRIMGSPQLIRFESDTVISDVEKKSAFKDADRTTVKLDKKMFGVYSSANAGHHFKLRLPVKFVFAIVFIIGAVFSGVLYIGKLKDQTSPTAAPDSTSVESVAAQVLPGLSLGKSGTAQPDRYFPDRKLRVADIPASAPMYDELTKPVSYPRLYCVSSSEPAIYTRNSDSPRQIVNGQPTVCQCYTQQGTRVPTEFQFCADVVRYGYFDPAIPDRGVSAPGDVQQVQQPSLQQAALAQPFESRQPSGPVVVPYQKARFAW